MVQGSNYSLRFVRPSIGGNTGIRADRRIEPISTYLEDSLCRGYIAYRWDWELTSSLARMVVPSDKWTKGQPLPSTSGWIDSTLTFCNKWMPCSVSRWRRKARCKFRFSVSLAISPNSAALVAEGSSAASKTMRASEMPSQTYITVALAGRGHDLT